MNFDLTDEQVALAELAEQIFTGSSPVERVVDIEATDDRFDRELWTELASANLLGVSVPEEHGGLGFGVFELCMVLEQQGRRVAPVPLLPSLVMGAMPVAEFGSAELQSALLPGVVDGSIVLSGAYQEWGANDPMTSSISAVADGDGWVLSGTKPAVPAAAVADRILVPAATGPDALTVFVIDPSAEGVSMLLSDTTNRELHGELVLDGHRVGADQVLGTVDQGRSVVAWAVERVNVAMAAIAVGCCAEATKMAAEYTSQREQFGRPLSTNQGVALRAADCYIDTDAMRLVQWQAAWRLDAGLPASEAVAVAKWWAAEGGQRVVHGTQHLHGGMGADVDYPVHRYFLWVKQLENTLGGGSWQLASLGARIAARAKAGVGA
ncbi:MAG: acyl-CoA dehydrogenase family protein [Acidimicrobiales bacterium]